MVATPFVVQLLTELIRAKKKYTRNSDPDHINLEMHSARAPHVEITDACKWAYNK